MSRLFFGASGVFILLLYGAVYSFNSFGMQPWYSANITVAGGALLSLLMNGAKKKGRGREARATFAMMTVANVALFVWSKPFADDQAKIIERAVSAKAAFGSASIGVSDAGIFNFVYGGRVINLDGLANDEIIRYAPNRLACYLADKRIEYLNGFGASSSAFSLRPLTDYATPFRVSSSRGVEEEFFHVDPNRVRALTECAQ